MIESHAHIAALGESLSTPSLSGCDSLGACLEQIEREAARARAGAWVRLAGAMPESWPERRLPTLEELDAACPDAACIVLSFDQHAGVCNTLALRLAGLSPNGSDVSACGRVLESAAWRAWEARPEPSTKERRGHVRDAIAHLQAYGYHEVHDLYAPDWLGPMLGELDRAGELGLRVVLYAPIERLESDARGKDRWQTPRVYLAGGKVFADGSLGARTAFVLDAYREPAMGVGPHGLMTATTREIEEGIQLSESLGLRLAMHAIGDGAVRACLNAVENASRLPRYDRALNFTSRHRIEHAELIDRADGPRFAGLGVVCSVQPGHILTDAGVLRRQQPGRLDRVLPLRELIESGCDPIGESGRGLICFGSDAPIVSADPAGAVRGAVHRRSEGVPERDAIGLSQAISERQAWACLGRTQE